MLIFKAPVPKLDDTIKDVCPFKDDDKGITMQGILDRILFPNVWKKGPFLFGQLYLTSMGLFFVGFTTLDRKQIESLQTEGAFHMLATGAVGRALGAGHQSDQAKNILTEALEEYNRVRERIKEDSLSARFHDENLSIYYIRVSDILDISLPSKKSKKLKVVTIFGDIEFHELADSLQELLVQWWENRDQYRSNETSEIRWTPTKALYYCRKNGCLDKPAGYEELYSFLMRMSDTSSIRTILRGTLQESGYWNILSLLKDRDPNGKNIAHRLLALEKQKSTIRLILGILMIIVGPIITYVTNAKSVGVSGYATYIILLFIVVGIAMFIYGWIQVIISPIRLVRCRRVETQP